MLLVNAAEWLQDFDSRKFTQKVSKKKNDAAV